MPNQSNQGLLAVFGLLTKLATGIVLLEVVAVLWLWSLDGSSSHKIRDVVERIQDAGEPLTFRQLNGDFSKATPNDAGRYYAAALALVVKTPDWPTAMQTKSHFKQNWTQFPGNARLDQEHQLAIRNLLGANQDTIAAVERASALPACHFDLGMSNGLAVTNATLDRVRMIARILSARTYAHLAESQPNAAAETIVANVRMLRILDRQPISLVHLVRLSLKAMIFDDITVMLQTGSPSEAALIQLAETLRHFEQPTVLPNVLTAERVYALARMKQAIDMPDLWPKDDPGVPERYSADFLVRPTRRDFAVGYLRDLSRMISATRQPWPDVLRSVEDLSMVSEYGEALKDNFKAVMLQTAETLAVDRSIQTALRIERFRQNKGGSLPEELADLTPQFWDEIPVDPFTGRPIFYKQSVDSYTVYSLGLDGRDNGGRFERHDDDEPRDWGVKLMLSLRVGG